MSFESHHPKRRMVSYTSAFALACSVAPGACLASPPAVNALPSGGQVVGGVAAIVTGERVLDVNQASQRAVIVWDRFDVGSGATVNFNQPGASAVTLNQVNSATRSIIDGAVNANGQVVIVNGNGILFGKDAVVNVGGLVATTMSPDRQKFMNGDSVQSFLGGSSSGSIVNEGRLAGNNLDSYIALMAPSVQNSGVIVAMLSEANTVALVAGEKVTLTFAGNRLVDVAVDAAVVNALISNKHLIQVGGGQVLISATDAFKLLGSTIRNEGRIAADGIQNVGGKVRLTAGTVSQSGSISVGSATGRGGDLVISAKDITLGAGSSIDASGGKGGGSVRLAASERIELAAGSAVSADAGPSGVGDGGSIVIIADLANTASSTRVGGALSARGGGGDGKGGFIETSGTRVDIADSAAVSTRSLGGNAGQYLIDPNDFEVSSTGNISGATLTSLLGSGNVTLQAGTGTDTATAKFGNTTTTGTQGNINIYDAVSWSANTLTLNSGFDINVGSSTRTGSLTVSGSGALVLNPSSSAVAGFTAGGTVLMGMAASPTGGPNSNGYNGSINLSATDATRLLATSASPVLTIDGSKYNVVTTAADLNRINTDLGGKYALGADLSIGGPLAPLGSGSNHTGVFDGLGHTVSATTVSCAADNCGFIASSSGQIRNLGLSYSAGISSAFSYVGGLLGTGNATIRNSYATGNVSGPETVGGLVGFGNGSTVTDSYATGTVEGPGISSNIGGLVGSGSGATFTRSYATGNVRGRESVGGLVGIGGTFTDSYATGNVEGTTDRSRSIGGLVGGGATTFTRSYATGSVSGFERVGGLVGDGPGATYTDSYATGSVTGTFQYVGGLVGNGQGATFTGSHASGAVVVVSGRYVGGLVGSGVRATFNNTYAEGSVTLRVGSEVGGLVGEGFNATYTDSYATGNVEGTNSGVGGLVGTGSGSTYTRSYATGSVKGFDLLGGLVANGGGSTFTDSYATGNVEGIGSSIGGLVGGGGTATFTRSHATGNVSGGERVGGLVGNGGSAIYTGSYATGAVVGTGDYVGGLVGDGGGSTFTNSYATSAVSGVNLIGGLVGNGQGGTFTTSHATGNVVGTGNGVGGLVGGAREGTIIDSYATGRVTGVNSVGGLAGSGDVATITNSYATGRVVGTGNNVGGLVGYGFLMRSLTGSYATGQVTGVDGVGGLVGFCQCASITDSHATGAVSGVNLVGGLVGNGVGSTVTSSHATGNVVGTGNGVGGLVGHAREGTIIDSYATGRVAGVNSVGGLAGSGDAATITNSYANGDVEGTGNSVGGLVGYAFLMRTVTGSYATGQVTGVDSVGGLVGFGESATFTDSYATGAVSGGQFVGGLVGFGQGSTVTSSHATGNVVGTGNSVGGLVGYGFQISGVTGSYATGRVTGVVGVGGLIGGIGSLATIASSYATGAVSGVSLVGGLVGNGQQATYTDSYATGAVVGTGSYVGGLVGIGDSATFTDSYATGYVSGVDYVGGLAGQGAGSSTAFTRSYATGNVVGTGTRIGGFVGNGFATTFTDNYWNSTNNPSLSVTTGGVGNASTATSGVTALTTAQMRSASSFSRSFGNDGGSFTVASGWGYGAVNVNQGFPVRCSVSMCVSYVGGSAVTTLFLLPLTGQTSTYGSAPVIDYLFYESASGSGTSYLPATVGASGIASYTITKGGGPYRSGTLLSTDGAGTYSLTYSGGISLSDTGFVVASTGYTTPVSFTIAPKALTVTANNTSKTFDSAAYTGGAGVTYSGFVNGESDAVLSGTLAYSGTSQGAVSVGSYVITPGGLSSGNYTIAFGDGTLTINAAPASGLMDPGTQFLSVGAAMGPGTGAVRGMGMGAPTTLAANSADDGGGDTGTSGGGGSGTASTAKRSDDGEDDSSTTDSSGTRTASAAKGVDQGAGNSSTTGSTAAAVASMAIRVGPGAGGSSTTGSGSAIGGTDKPDFAKSSCVGKECVRGLRPTLNKLKAGLVSLLGAQNPKP